MALIDRCAALRPGPVDPITAAPSTRCARSPAAGSTSTPRSPATTSVLDRAHRDRSARPAAAFGIGPDTAAEMLIVAGDNPDRVRSEAAFAKLCGVAPIPASSGMTTRHRLNRGGHRQANAALYRVVIVRMRFHQPTMRLRRPPHRRRQDQSRDHPLPQALLAREIWAPMRPLRTLRQPRPTAA